MEWQTDLFVKVYGKNLPEVLKQTKPFFKRQNIEESCVFGGIRSEALKNLTLILSFQA